MADRHYHPRHFRKRSRCPGSVASQQAGTATGSGSGRASSRVLSSHTDTLTVYSTWLSWGEAHGKKIKSQKSRFVLVYLVLLQLLGAPVSVYGLRYQVELWAFGALWDPQ